MKTITIDALGIAAVKISSGPAHIYVDAFIEEGLINEFDSTDATHIIVTHEHSDHFNPEKIAENVHKTGALVFGPPSICYSLLIRYGIEADKLTIMYDQKDHHPCSSYKDDLIELFSFPSVHFFDECRYSIHNSYFLKTENKKIYITGDTSEFTAPDKDLQDLDAILYNFVIPDKDITQVDEVIRIYEKYKPKKLIVNHTLDCDWTLPVSEINARLTDEQKNVIAVTGRENSRVLC